MIDNATHQFVSVSWSILNVFAIFMLDYAAYTRPLTTISTIGGFLGFGWLVLSPIVIGAIYAKYNKGGARVHSGVGDG